MFTDVKNAIDYIENIKRKEKRKDLSRMKYALEKLGNPQKSFKAIHVAGTNGKGSTVCYLSNILIKMGYNVGTFISPYVIKFNERIMFNMQYISDDDLLFLANKVKEVCDQIYLENNDVVTFFEFITLMGFLYFKMKKVDYCVIEVGMGGLLDATNTLENNPLRLITNIGFDHMNSLGNTLEEIASNKLGILHNNETLITTVSNDLLDYFKSYCTLKNANLIHISDDDIKIIKNTNSTIFSFEGIKYETPLIGNFQAYNAALAIKAIKYLFKDVDPKIINEGLKSSYWPGRMQVVLKKPLVIVDGGHNIHGISAIVDSLKSMTDKKIKVLFTALHDKEIDKMIKKLEEISSFFIFTEIDDRRASNALELKELTIRDNIVIPNIYDAIKYSLDNTKEDEVLLITGSLHFVSNVLNYFNKN